MGTLCDGHESPHMFLGATFVTRRRGISHRSQRSNWTDTTAGVTPLRSAAAPDEEIGRAAPRPDGQSTRHDPRSAGGRTHQPALIITAAYTPSVRAETRSKLPHGILIVLLIAVTGVALAGLWRPWIDHGSSPGRQPTMSGADHMAIGSGAGHEAAGPTQHRRTSRAAKQLAAVSAAGFMWPAPGIITQEFGCTLFELEPWNSSLGCRFHYGIDIANVPETPILAAKAGQVVFAGWKDDDGYGYRVMLDNGDGVQTLYAHLCCPPDVQAGQDVAQGVTIGLMGSTGASSGSHLHFAVEVGGVAVDPRGYLPEGPPAA